MLKRQQAKTLRVWMLENVSEDLKDIAERGCEGGFRGLLYYHETSTLYDAYEGDIWGTLEEQAEALGYGHALALIASMNGAKQVSEKTTFKHLLVWSAVEELARQITAEKEEEIL